MSLRIRLLVSIAVLVAGFGLSNASALAAAPSATGGGATTFYSFGFTAQSHRDGSVSGNAEFQFPSSNISLHVRINCLAIIGQNAYMSGTTTEQTDGLAEGTEILFGVQDNDTTGLPDLRSSLELVCRPDAGQARPAMKGDRSRGPLSLRVGSIGATPGGATKKSAL
jgi:hypothetical protein